MCCSAIIIKTSKTTTIFKSRKFSNNPIVLIAHSKFRTYYPQKYAQLPLYINSIENATSPSTFTTSWVSKSKSIQLNMAGYTKECIFLTGFFKLYLSLSNKKQEIKIYFEILPREEIR